MLYHVNFFFFNDTATTEIYTLSLHDALPISAPGRPEVERDGGREHRPLDGKGRRPRLPQSEGTMFAAGDLCRRGRSEEHTSELQSPCNIVCRLLLEKKIIKIIYRLIRKI